MTRKQIIKKFNERYAKLDKDRNELLDKLCVPLKHIKILSRDANKLLNFSDNHCYEKTEKGMIHFKEFEDFAHKIFDLECLYDVADKLEDVYNFLKDDK